MLIRSLSSEGYKLLSSYLFCLICLVLLIVFTASSIYAIRDVPEKATDVFLVSKYSFLTLTGIIYSAVYIGFEFQSGFPNKHIFAGIRRYIYVITKFVYSFFVGLSALTAFNLLIVTFTNINAFETYGNDILITTTILSLIAAVSFVFKDIIISASIPAIAAFFLIRTVNMQAFLNLTTEYECLLMLLAGVFCISALLFCSIFICRYDMK